MNRYSVVGRLAAHEYVNYGPLGEFLGAGSEAAPISLCADCGCIVANQPAHDAWHVRVAAPTARIGGDPQP